MTQNELMHYGVLGMKWGVRRYQNEDGSYKKGAEGRYSDSEKTDLNIYQHTNNYQEYRKRGYTENSSKYFAKRNQKIKKIIYVTGGVAIASLAAYGTYKYIKSKNAGKVAANSMLQRIERFSTTDLHDVFYASVNAKDNVNYANVLGANKNYKFMLRANSDIKIASRKDCINAYKDLMSSKGKKINSISLNRSYDMFNKDLVNRSEDAEKFYDILRSRGFGALQDVNDMKYSKINAKNPLIVLDKSLVTIESITERAGDSSAWKKQAYKDVLVSNGKTTVKEAAALSATITGMQAIKDMKDFNELNSNKGE